MRLPWLLGGHPAARAPLIRGQVRKREIIREPGEADVLAKVTGFNKIGEEMAPRRRPPRCPHAQPMGCSDDRRQRLGQYCQLSQDGRPVVPSSRRVGRPTSPVRAPSRRAVRLSVQAPDRRCWTSLPTTTWTPRVCWLTVPSRTTGAASPDAHRYFSTTPRQDLAGHRARSATARQLLHSPSRQVCVRAEVWSPRSAAAQEDEERDGGCSSQKVRARPRVSARLAAYTSKDGRPSV